MTPRAMFALTTGTIDRPLREAHTAATAFSIAAHVFVLGSIVWVVLFSVSDKLPEVPTMMAFVATVAPPPPPPPPPPAARGEKASNPSKPTPTTGPAFFAPAEIPVGIQPETGFDPGDEGGVVGGVEGGIPGGVLGGLLAGMVTEVMPPPPTPSKPRRVGGDVQEPALIHRVEPVYPPVAVSGKLSGTVILEATVTETGVVSDVQVLRSIPLLDKAATKAVKQWRYQPLILNGEPVPFILTVTVTFSIR
jgi:protein TonB